MIGAFTSRRTFVNVDENVWLVLGVILLALCIGTVIRFIAFARAKELDDKLRQRLRSLTTWWGLVGLLLAVVLLGLPAAVMLFVFASLQGMQEFRRLMQSRVSTERLWWWAFLAIPVHYGIAYLGVSWLFFTFIPVWVFVAILMSQVMVGKTSEFLESSGNVFLGLMLIVFLLSHAALIMSLPEDTLFPAGVVGLFVYMIVLTESNDIAQAIWGRRFGRRKIVPRVSPNKTWEGLLLGASTTIVLAVALAPLLTPFSGFPAKVNSSGYTIPYLPAVVAGALIAGGGFFGDITISAIKREVGVKDSGDLLPGQGGMLDRVDSLTFTAPLFFYFIYSLYI